MFEQISALHGTEVKFRVNKCTALPKVDKGEFFKIEAELVEGGIEFTALSDHKVNTGNVYSRVITVRKGKEASDMPFVLSHPEPPKNIYDAPPSNTAEIPEGLKPGANMDYLASIDHGYTPEQIALMEANGIIPPGTPQPIITDYLANCKMIGANPFLKDMYLIKRNSKQGVKFQKTMAIGFARKKASNTGKSAGTEFFYDGIPSREWTMKAQSKDTPNFITCVVYRRESENGDRDAYEITICCADYIKAAGGTNPMYEAQKLAMLNKCAHMAGLRVAFPEVLAEAYVEEEFYKDQTQNLSAYTVEKSTKPMLSLEAANKELDLIENLSDELERKSLLREVFVRSEHLKDENLLSRLQSLTSHA